MVPGVWVSLRQCVCGCVCALPSAAWSPVQQANANVPIPGVCVWEGGGGRGGCWGAFWGSVLVVTRARVLMQNTETHTLSFAFQCL